MPVTAVLRAPKIPIYFFLQNDTAVLMKAACFRIDVASVVPEK